MKKAAFPGIVLFFGLSPMAFAGTGNANDGFEFILALIVILSLILGFLQGIDYIQKNGKSIVHRSLTCWRRMLHNLSELFNKANNMGPDISFSGKVASGKVG